MNLKNNIIILNVINKFLCIFIRNNKGIKRIDYEIRKNNKIIRRRKRKIRINFKINDLN